MRSETRTAPGAGIALGGLSLKHHDAPQKDTGAVTPAPGAQAPLRDTPFSDADFEQAWITVRGAFTSERLLTGIISAAMPSRKEGDLFTISVGTEMQSDIVGQFQKPIEAKLRDLLQNDNVKLEVAICEGDIPPSFWTDQQVLDHIIKEHPSIAQMISKYKMRLE